MVAPAENFTAAKGAAALGVEMVFRDSTVTSAFATNPMKLLTPRSRGKSVWAYTSSFGGGLVAGDQTRLHLRVGKDARCFVGTQASTKIYRNPSQLPCGHTTVATLEENAVLVFAPDSVQAFADSIYVQRQEFHLARGAGLALVDWFSSGRTARGERWIFKRLQSRNEVWSAEESKNKNGPAGGSPAELMFLDSLALDSQTASIGSPHVTGRFDCIGMLLFIGPPMKEFAAALLERVAKRPVERCAELVVSASPVRDGALLRFAGESVETVAREIHHEVKRLSALLGDDPWMRKW